VNGNRLIGRVALLEIIALQHPRDGIARGELNEIGGIHLPHPARIERHLGEIRVENAENLLAIGLGIAGDIFRGQWLTGLIAPGGVTDHAGEVTDEKNHLMAEGLELPQLINQDGMAEMQVGGGRIEARLDSQCTTALQPLT